MTASRRVEEVFAGENNVVCKLTLIDVKVSFNKHLAHISFETVGSGKIKNKGGLCDQIDMRFFGLYVFYNVSDLLRLHVS